MIKMLIIEAACTAARYHGKISCQIVRTHQVRECIISED